MSRKGYDSKQAGEIVTAVTEAYDQGWIDALTNISQMLRSASLTKEQVLEVVETIRSTPPLPSDSPATPPKRSDSTPTVHKPHSEPQSVHPAHPNSAHINAARNRRWTDPPPPREPTTPNPGVPEKRPR